MRRFNNDNSFGGPRGGNRFGGRDSRPRRLGHGDSQRSEMHDAVCAECGKSCRVPFLPVSGKPVFCSDCFEKRSTPEFEKRRPMVPGAFGTQRNAEKRPFSSAQPVYQKNDSDKLEAINSKLDKILKTLAYLAKKVTPTPEETQPQVSPSEAQNEVGDVLVSVVEEMATLTVETTDTKPAKAKSKKPSKKKAT